ncbi:MAG: hypothetical protein JWM17_2053, partial [Actinobacteria bacterium]|nr:hypothetical protein [Actinomycetota bacterium]
GRGRGGGGGGGGGAGAGFCGRGGRHRGRRGSGVRGHRQGTGHRLAGRLASRSRCRRRSHLGGGRRRCLRGSGRGCRLAGPCCVRLGTGCRWRVDERRRGPERVDERRRGRQRVDQGRRGPECHRGRCGGLRTGDGAELAHGAGRGCRSEQACVGGNRTGRGRERHSDSSHRRQCRPSIHGYLRLASGEFSGLQRVGIGRTSVESGLQGAGTQSVKVWLSAGQPLPSTPDNWGTVTPHIGLSTKA